MKKLIVTISAALLILMCACHSGKSSSADCTDNPIYIALSNLNEKLAEAKSAAEIRQLLSAPAGANGTQEMVDSLFPEVMQGLLDGKNPSEALDEVISKSDEIAANPEMSGSGDAIASSAASGEETDDRDALVEGVGKLFVDALEICSEYGVDYNSVYDKYMSVITASPQFNEEDREKYAAILSVGLSAYKFWNKKLS